MTALDKALRRWGWSSILMESTRTAGLNFNLCLFFSSRSLKRSATFLTPGSCDVISCTILDACNFLCSLTRARPPLLAGTKRIDAMGQTRPLLEGLGCQRLKVTLQPCDGEFLNKQGPRESRANPRLEEAELLLTGQRCLVDCCQHLLQRTPERRPCIIIAGVNPH